MTDIVINLVSQATTPDGQPAVTISLDLTIGNTPNGDGSYTVTAASGTYVSTDASENATTLSMSLAPGSIDGADNELFLNGGAKFDLGGITFTTTNLTTTPPTPGDPNAATFAGSLDAATYTGPLQTYPQDVNLFGSIRITYAHCLTGRIPAAAARTARGVGCRGSTAR